MTSRPKTGRADASACLLALFAAALLAAPKAPDATRWWSHILFLADDKLEGREAGSEGHRRAAAYVASQFERAGLKPEIQPLKLPTRRIFEDRSCLALVRDGNPDPISLDDDSIISVRVEPK